MLLNNVQLLKVTKNKFLPAVTEQIALIQSCQASEFDATDGFTYLTLDEATIFPFNGVDLNSFVGSHLSLLMDYQRLSVELTKLEEIGVSNFFDAKVYKITCKVISQ